MFYIPIKVSVSMRMDSMLWWYSNRRLHITRTLGIRSDDFTNWCLQTSTCMRIFCMWFNYNEQCIRAQTHNIYITYTEYLITTATYRVMFLCFLIALAILHCCWNLLPPLVQWGHRAIDEHLRPALTHWGRDTMTVIFQTTFSNAFSWMKTNFF